MKKTPDTPPTGSAAPSREDRIKAALKANMAKRKAQAQARARRAAGTLADEPPKKQDD